MRSIFTAPCRPCVCHWGPFSSSAVLVLRPYNPSYFTNSSRRNTCWLFTVATKNFIHSSLLLFNAIIPPVQSMNECTAQKLFSCPADIPRRHKSAFQPALHIPKFAFRNLPHTVKFTKDCDALRIFHFPCHCTISSCFPYFISTRFLFRQIYKTSKKQPADSVLYKYPFLIHQPTGIKFPCKVPE